MSNKEKPLGVNTRCGVYAILNQFLNTTKNRNCDYFRVRVSPDHKTITISQKPQTKKGKQTRLEPKSL